MTITTTKLVDNNNKIIVNSNGIGGEFQQKLVDVVSSNNASSEPKVSIANMQYEILGTGNLTVYFKNDTTKQVVISGRGNWGLKPDEDKIMDTIGDISLNSDDTVTKYNINTKFFNDYFDREIEEQLGE